MARKRLSKPPPPPPPPQQQQEESSSGEEEEEEEAAKGSPAAKILPQNPKPSSAAADDDAGSDSSEGGDDEDQEAGESSDSEDDAQAFQLRHVTRSPREPPPAPPSESESDAGEEEGQGESSDSEPDNPPDPVQKKPAKKTKDVAEKKRPAPEPGLSGKAKKAKGEGKDPVPEPTAAGKAKKAKAGVEKEAPEPTSPGKGKKAKARVEKEAPEPIPSGKLKKPRAEPDKAAGKSEKPERWKKDDEIKILEAILNHIKSQGVYPKTDDLIAAVGDSLDRKNCSYIQMYEKVRQLKQRYEKVASTGALPDKDDDLRIHRLSEAIWGENAKEVTPASKSRSSSALSNSKKGKTTGSENVATLTGSKSGQATKGKMEGDMESKTAKRAITSTDTSPAKGVKRKNHKEESNVDVKSGTSKETTTTSTRNDGNLIQTEREETDKEKMNADVGSVMPKATSASENGVALAKSKKGETQEKTDTYANVEGIQRGFEELQGLYPNLTSYVESIGAQHPCGETLKRAFYFIGDEKASTLESRIKKQNVTDLRIRLRRADTTKEVVNTFIGLQD